MPRAALVHCLAPAAGFLNGTSHRQAPFSSRICTTHPAQLRRPPILGWRRCSTSFAVFCCAVPKPAVLNNGSFAVVNLATLIAGSHLLAMEAQRAIALRLKVATGKSGGEAGGALQHAWQAVARHWHQGAGPSPPPSTRLTTSSN